MNEMLGPSPHSHLFSMPIFESLFAVNDTKAPVKKHKKRNQNRGYHRRIQKKWLKKFGTVKAPAIFQMGNRFIVHPALMPELRKAMAK